MTKVAQFYKVQLTEAQMKNVIIYFINYKLLYRIYVRFESNEYPTTTTQFNFGFNKKIALHRP